MPDSSAAQARGDIPPDPPNPTGKPTEPTAASVHRQIVRLLVPWYRRPAYRLAVWRLRFRNWRLSRG